MATIPADIDRRSARGTFVTPWDEVGWLDDALAWIADRVGRPGRVSDIHPEPWSAVLKVEVNNRVMWFKELGAAHAFEPALTETLARAFPSSLPQILATEGRRMLTLDAGLQIAFHKDVSAFTSTWAGVLARFAELQIELSSAPSLPAPDCRPETLAQKFGGEAERLVDALGDAIPHSVIHEDLAQGNVFFRNTDPVFIDWAGGAISHPFCTMTKPLHKLLGLGARPAGPEILRLRDAYLEPWTTFAPARELRRIFAAAYPLGALCRVLGLEQKLAELPPSTLEPYARKIPKLLKRFAESARTLEQLAV
jgi:hypothetical protein